MGAYSRVGAYLRQRFWGTYSIILFLGWALIRGVRLIEALRYRIFAFTMISHDLASALVGVSDHRSASGKYQTILYETIEHPRTKIKGISAQRDLQITAVANDSYIDLV